MLGRALEVVIWPILSGLGLNLEKPGARIHNFNFDRL
jgi:hypothetical protein